MQIVVKIEDKSYVKTYAKKGGGRQTDRRIDSKACERQVKDR